MSRYCCPECSYCYDETLGDAHQGFAAGTSWEELQLPGLRRARQTGLLA